MAMNRSKASYGRSRVVRVCALAFVRLWVWTLILVITALLLNA
jgi:hypothetical protein